MISVECGNLIMTVLVAFMFFLLTNEEIYFYSLYFSILLIVINNARITFYYIKNSILLTIIY